MAEGRGEQKTQTDTALSSQTDAQGKAKGRAGAVSALPGSERSTLTPRH